MTTLQTAGAALDSADKLKELIARQAVEIERLTDINRDALSNLNELADTKNAEIERLKLHIKHIGNDAFRTENVELRARLAENEQQEPVAWMMVWGNHAPSFTTDKSDYVTWFAGKATYPENLKPLFAAAGASPEPSALQAENAKLITALAECRDAFPAPDAGSDLDGWYVSAIADPLEVPDYVKACVGASPVQPSQAPEGWNPSSNQMTAERAAYFMRRFKRDEKLLGPNEQAAVDYVIALLEKPDQAAELSDTQALNFMEQDRGNRVLSIGTGWYSRSSYGKPLKRVDSLRAAIIAAINAKESK